MQVFESLLHRLDTQDDIPTLRRQIFDMIFEHLDCRRLSLDDWEKIHLANAIGALALNVNSLQQPTTAWLRLCLQDLKAALTPESMRDKSYIPRAVGSDRPSCEDLFQALDSISRKVL